MSEELERIFSRDGSTWKITTESYNCIFYRDNSDDCGHTRNISEICQEMYCPLKKDD